MAPPGLVPVKHSIHVDVEGALPPGKVLLMTGTFKGAAVIDTGTLVPFIIGRYEFVRLYLIDSGDLPKVEAIREKWVPGTSAYEARDAITDRGRPAYSRTFLYSSSARTSTFPEMCASAMSVHLCPSRHILERHGKELENPG